MRCNLKREATSLATYQPQLEQLCKACFNLKREATSLATVLASANATGKGLFQSQARGVQVMYH